MDRELTRARRLVDGAARVVAFTGAGISAESGVPTFRGGDVELWRGYRPEELASTAMLQRHPRTVWEWYDSRRRRLGEILPSGRPRIRPNPGHLALARFVLRRGEQGIITQNVDGLHTQAAREEASPGGSAEAAVPLELHGNIMRDRCSDERCGARTDPEPLGEALPRCAACGEMRRPDVILFGEFLDPGVLRRAELLAERADVCLVVGTSAVVYPAAGVVELTRASGGALIEVNLRRTGIARATDVTLQGKAGEVLPELLDGL